MTDYKYDVSLRVKHPELKAKEVCDGLELSAAIKWDVGEQRQTPTGRKLDGVYTETYCSFKLSHGDESLPEFLVKTNSQLKTKAQFLNELVLTGGSIEYFIGWYLDGNTGEVFDYLFLQELSEMGISLSFDLYP